MSTYNLSDFSKILENNYIEDLPNDINNIINELLIKVGSPEYIKTPQFKNTKSNHLLGGNNYHKKKNE